MPISEYILNFERLYNKAAKHGMALPDTVRAFKLLKCLNLPDSERRMVLSSCKDLKYDDIKSALKKTFGSLRNNGESTSFKEEAVFWTSSRNKQIKKADPKRQNIKQNGTNPLGRDGKITRCARCSSTYHWVANCPEKDTTNDNANVTNTIHEECQEEPSVSYAHVTQALLSVCLGKAVVDTACTATVCGLKWLVDFLKRLPSELEKQVKTLSTCRSICFGDNQPEKMFSSNIRCRERLLG